jgi:hypothetical protein
MKIEHLVLAKGSSVDRDTQSLSVFEMIEQMQIQAPQFPVNVPVHAVLVFRRSDVESGVLIEPWRLSVLGPDRKTLLSQNLEVRLEAEHLRQRVRINFPIQVSVDGIYSIQLTHVNKIENTRTLEVDVKAIVEISRKALKM